MIKEVYQRLFKNISPLLSSTNVFIYSKEVPLLNEYLQKASVDVIESFDISDLSKYSLVVIDPSMEFSELSKDVLSTLITTGQPIILPYTDTLDKYKKELNYYIYDICKHGPKQDFVTIRQVKYCSSFLNFYIRFQEDNQLQRFLDNDQVTNFMELLYTVAKDFYDIKAKLVYPFEGKGSGHSGCFILGESHWCWTYHTWPEQGRLDMSINSCTNKNSIPILKQAIINMFKLDPKYVYSDYKEVDIHFH